MNIKQKIIILVLAITFSTGLSLQAQTAQAETCGGVETSIISCTQGKDAKTAKDSAVWGLLIMALNILTAGVGIAAVGGVVFGSLLYASAGDKAEQTKKAIGVITNVVIGIVAYGVMYIGLNFLIPGGIFN